MYMHVCACTHTYTSMTAFPGGPTLYIREVFPKRKAQHEQQHPDLTLADTFTPTDNCLGKGNQESRGPAFAIMPKRAESERDRLSPSPLLLICLFSTNSPWVPRGYSIRREDRPKIFVWVDDN